MTRQRWIVLHVVLILLIAYVSSYFLISRLRWQEAMTYRSPGFLYVPAERVFKEPEESWLRVHYGLAFFYWPINILHREFGGPAPIMCFLRIGEKKGK